MVAYEQFVKTVREEAESQGADLSDFETNSDLVSVAGSIWRDRKGEIRQASPTEARRIASEEVTVR